MTVLFGFGVSCVDAGLITSADAVGAVGLGEIEASSPHFPLQDEEVVTHRGGDGEAGLAGTGTSSAPAQLWSEHRPFAVSIETPLTGLVSLINFSVPPDPDLGGLIKPPRRSFA